MLFYHGRGRRDYRRQPLPASRRNHWELAAILAGRARPAGVPAQPGDDAPALWIFPPRHAHGWESAHPGGCTVCIIHVAACPCLVADAAEEAGHLRIPLDAAARRSLARADALAAALLARRGDAGEIAAELLRGECCRLAVLHLPATRRGPACGERTLKRALAWLDDHLAAGATLAHAAHAIGVAPSHLRRLAHRHGGRSPRGLLAGLRLERAADLLRRGDGPLEDVAIRCGYASASALSRAFLRRHGVRPGAWRAR